MGGLINFISNNKPLFDTMHALSSVVSLFGWLASLAFITVAWWRGRIAGLRVFGAEVTLQQREAVVAASRAVRQHGFDDEARKSGQRARSSTAELEKIKAVIERAFRPEVQANMLGKAILWADDNPANNESEVIALRKMGLTVTQVLSTADALDALVRHPFDLVISDLGRGADQMAGYQLLDAIRARGDKIPFLLYAAGGSLPEHNAQARSRSALGSTDYPHELFEHVVSVLGGTQY